MDCPICGSVDVRTIRTIKSPHNALHYTLFGCWGCDSEFFDAGEHRAESLDHFYDERSRNLTPIFRKFEPSKLWQHEVDLLHRLLPRSPQSVVDVGCRSGEFLLHWPGSVERVGIEIAKPFAELAIRRGLEVHAEPIEVVELDRRFDVVSCYAILEHLPRPQAALRRLAQLLAPGGCLVVMIPSFESWKARTLTRMGRRWHMYEPPEHLSLFSRRALDAQLETYGLTLVRRRFAAGGMFNPFRRVPWLGNRFSRLMEWSDQHAPTHRLPIFDHMYSYYQKTAG